MLELKEIAPYLGYGIKLYDTSSKTILKLDDFCNTIIPEEFRNQFGNTGLSQLMADNKIKLILYPMSSYMNESSLSFKDLASILNEAEDYTAKFLFGKIKLQSEKIALALFVDLITDHYDVFGLIEKGFAIDVETIENNINLLNI